MRSLPIALVAAAVVESVACLAIGNHHVIHESLDVLPQGWQCHGEPDDSEPITLRIALSQDHRNYLHLAHDISDPSSSRYGHHLDADELRAALPDSSFAATTAIGWLKNNSISTYTKGHDFVEFTTSVNAANRLLDTKFSSYTNGDAAPVFRTQHYSLPAHMTQHIDFIYPTVHFFSSTRRRASALQPRQHIPTGPSNCSNSVCPPQLRKQYNINYAPRDNSSGSRIGVCGFLDNFPNRTDWSAFAAKHANASVAAPPYAVAALNGGVTRVQSGALTVEPLLDLDYVAAFTGALPVTFYSAGGRGQQLKQPGNKPLPAAQSQNEPYLEFLQYLLALKAPPQVVSISYSDDEQSVPAKYAARVCDLFAQAAMRGITVVGSSGDGGAAGTGGDSSCVGPKGGRRFIPTFPSACPWITSVGATAGYGGAASFSSGGFSNYFARPAWQQRAVTGYFAALNGTHAKYYNASGRGIPDVSLVGDDYLIITAGYESAVDGTSASAPVFAAMVALLNDLRLRAKKPVLGHLNPLLYSAGLQSVFKDVVDGQSVGCADGNFFEPGWEALKGWDAATGLGEPDFAKLRAKAV